MIRRGKLFGAGLGLAGAGGASVISAVWREATGDLVAPWRSPVGAEFAVIYDPAKPEDVRAPLAWPFFGGLFAAFALGLVLLAFSI